jgi:aminoglycoside phosphotransferase (APT) family kinase protein
MTRSELLPSAGALDEVRRLAGSSAAILRVVRLRGGQHADTWRVEIDSPPFNVVVREFPTGDPAARREQRVLRTLDGLGGLAPVLLSGDLDGKWSPRPTTLITWLDGESDITPSSPQAWAHELGRALARVHLAPSDGLAGLPSVFDGGAAQARLDGPLAPGVRSRWSEIVGSPAVLTHGDYWSGNVVWRDGALVGIVDWSAGARGPRGFDVGWCRLDLVLLFDERTADVFLAAYEGADAQAFGERRLWDRLAAARSHAIVATWASNYAPLGRGDLDESELRRRHSRWTARLMEQA